MNSNKSLVAAVPRLTVIKTVTDAPNVRRARKNRNASFLEQTRQLMETFLSSPAITDTTDTGDTTTRTTTCVYPTHAITGATVVENANYTAMDKMSSATTAAAAASTFNNNKDENTQIAMMNGTHVSTCFSSSPSFSTVSSSSPAFSSSACASTNAPAAVASSTTVPVSESGQALNLSSTALWHTTNGHSTKGKRSHLKRIRTHDIGDDTIDEEDENLLDHQINSSPVPPPSSSSHHLHHHSSQQQQQQQKQDKQQQQLSTPVSPPPPTSSPGAATLSADCDRKADENNADIIHKVKEEEKNSRKEVTKAKLLESNSSTSSPSGTNCLNSMRIRVKSNEKSNLQSKSYAAKDKQFIHESVPVHCESEINSTDKFLPETLPSTSGTRVCKMNSSSPSIQHVNQHTDAHSFLFNSTGEANRPHSPSSSSISSYGTQSCLSLRRRRRNPPPLSSSTGAGASSSPSSSFSSSLTRSRSHSSAHGIRTCSSRERNNSLTSFLAPLFSSKSSKSNKRITGIKSSNRADQCSSRNFMTNMSSNDNNDSSHLISHTTEIKSKLDELNSSTRKQDSPVYSHTIHHRTNTSMKGSKLDVTSTSSITGAPRSMKVFKTDSKRRRRASALLHKSSAMRRSWNVLNNPYVTDEQKKYFTQVTTSTCLSHYPGRRVTTPSRVNRHTEHSGANVNGSLIVSPSPMPSHIQHQHAAIAKKAAAVAAASQLTNSRFINNDIDAGKSNSRMSSEMIQETLDEKNATYNEIPLVQSVTTTTKTTKTTVTASSESPVNGALSSPVTGTSVNGVIKNTQKTLLLSEHANDEKEIKSPAEQEEDAEEKEKVIDDASTSSTASLMDESPDSPTLTNWSSSLQDRVKNYQNYLNANNNNAKSNNNNNNNVPNESSTICRDDETLSQEENTCNLSNVTSLLSSSSRLQYNSCSDSNQPFDQQREQHQVHQQQQQQRRSLFNRGNLENKRRKNKLRSFGASMPVFPEESSLYSSASDSGDSYTHKNVNEDETHWTSGMMNNNTHGQNDCHVQYNTLTSFTTEIPVVHESVSDTITSTTTLSEQDNSEQCNLSTVKQDQPIYRSSSYYYYSTDPDHLSNDYTQKVNSHITTSQPVLSSLTAAYTDDTASNDTETRYYYHQGTDDLSSNSPPIENLSKSLSVLTVDCKPLSQSTCPALPRTGKLQMSGNLTLTSIGGTSPSETSCYLMSSSSPSPTSICSSNATASSSSTKAGILKDNRRGNLLPGSTNIDSVGGKSFNNIPKKVHFAESYCINNFDSETNSRHSTTLHLMKSEITEDIPYIEGDHQLHVGVKESLVDHQGFLSFTPTGNNVKTSVVACRIVQEDPSSKQRGEEKSQQLHSKLPSSTSSSSASSLSFENSHRNHLNDQSQQFPCTVDDHLNEIVSSESFKITHRINETNNSLSAKHLSTGRVISSSSSSSSHENNAPVASAAKYYSSSARFNPTSVMKSPHNGTSICSAVSACASKSNLPASTSASSASAVASYLSSANSYISHTGKSSDERANCVIRTAV